MPFAIPRRRRGAWALIRSGELGFNPTDVGRSVEAVHAASKAHVSSATVAKRSSTLLANAWSKKAPRLSGKSGRYWRSGTVRPLRAASKSSLGVLPGTGSSLVSDSNAIVASAHRSQRR